MSSSCKSNNNQSKKLNSKFKIFVGGISNDESESELKEFFNQYGNITGVKFFGSRIFGIRKGYCHITFKEKEAYDKCLKQTYKNFKNRRLICRPLLKGQKLKAFNQKYNMTRIHVKGIPKEWNNVYFTDFFRKFGEVENGYILKHHISKKQLNYGFISFHSAESVQNCVDQSPIKEGKIKLLVSKFDIDKSSNIQKSQKGVKNKKKINKKKNEEKFTEKKNKKMKKSYGKFTEDQNLNNFQNINCKEHFRRSDRNVFYLRISLSHIPPVVSKYFSVRRLAFTYDHNESNLGFNQITTLENTSLKNLNTLWIKKWHGYQKLF